MPRFPDRERSSAGSSQSASANSISLARWRRPLNRAVRGTGTASGQSGRWEFIEYEDVKNYVTEIDRTTGQSYRRLVNVTRVEKGKIAVEFENDLVTAVEESEDHQGGNVRIIVPPLVFRW